MSAGTVEASGRGSEPVNLVVVTSSGGASMQNLIDLIALGQLPARIRGAIITRPGVGAIDRAVRAEIPHFVIQRKHYSSADEFSHPLYEVCDEVGADLVCLAGCLSLVTIPERYRNRVMNCHPTLLPIFGGRGMYGYPVHRAVLERGCRIAGCTVHFADESYDTGPIIVQRTCPVLDDDTVETLALRVHAEEKVAYPEAIRLFGEGRLHLDGRHVRVLPPG